MVQIYDFFLLGLLSFSILPRLTKPSIKKKTTLFSEWIFFTLFVGFFSTQVMVVHWKKKTINSLKKILLNVQ